MTKKEKRRRKEKSPGTGFGSVPGLLLIFKRVYMFLSISIKNKIAELDINSPSRTFE